MVVKRRAFELHLEGPLDFAQTLAVLNRFGDDLIDRWDGKWLLRTMRIAGDAVAYSARVAGTCDAPTLEVVVEKAAHADAMRPLIERSFLKLPSTIKTLCANDLLIARLVQIHRGFRPMLHPDFLVALIRCISAQQVNLRWAATTRRRLVERYGRAHEIDGRVVYSLDAEALALAEVADIRALQFTTRKAEYIVNVARAVVRGELDSDLLATMPDDAVIACITKVRGLGVWTAEWILARTLGRPRVSASDLGVRKAVGKAYFGGLMPSPDEVRQATTHWGQAAGFVQELLLHAQHEHTLFSGNCVGALC
jgi:DNA-3-methyladenine glycosylase II